MVSEKEKLSEIARQIRDDEICPQETVRNFLSWFNQKRRGYVVVSAIRQALAEAKLSTDPDFEGAYIDSYVRFVSLDNPDKDMTEGFRSLSQEEKPEFIAIELVSGAVADPTFRVGQLASANTQPISVNPDAPIEEALTLMMMYDFSQLPVMQDERKIKGIISWESIGRRLALKRSCEAVRDCMETAASEVPAKSSLFAAIDQIIKYGYVLVRQDDNKISGIVTTSDLSLQFRLSAEPFLLIGEIENYIRRLIDKRFTIDQLKSVRDPADERSIETVADLTFGEYVRLLETPEHWNTLDLAISRNVFTTRLDHVRKLRNDVMHFDPDPLDDKDIQALRTFVDFMRDLVAK